MTTGDIQESVWQGTFTVFGVELKCHVLSDGSRIIEGESLAVLLEAMATGDRADVGDITEFAKWQRQK